MKTFASLASATLLLVTGMTVTAAAAPMNFASGAGTGWTSDNAAVCSPGAAPCAGSTVAITPHGAWQGNNPDGTDAVWVSYADTGVTGSLAPINQPNNGLLMSISYTLSTVVNSPINLKVWADDTARIWFNGGVVLAPNLTQGTCAVGSIGCEPNEFAAFNWLATGTDTIRIDVYQVGTGTTANSNPFGVLYYGSYEQAPAGDPVPEPASMALLGLGLLGAGVARRRRR